MKTASEKVWAAVFGGNIPASETLKDDKGITPAIGNPELLDSDDTVTEGVCVMDFSGFREYLKENSI